MTSFGTRLKKERMRLGLSQKQLAELAGIQTNAQGHYERDNRSPTVRYLHAIESHGVDITYVLSGKLVAHGITEDEHSAILCRRALPERGRKLIDEMLSMLTTQA
ncbi:helix-turn-helix domain-containing protein [Pseudomonas typographi]|uniref:helix-turn-helix domain-containing protein n=1 Tax=Pseudomonas typographi TaxID=2715964 RepID=UPI001685AD71|nr:helix-turn-helix transcriptional regulator [Pseudomonas typographi]MBD1590307.1 helix-turn-helix transcriptional regulator [Pseudomonas typographi]